MSLTRVVAVKKNSVKVADKATWQEFVKRLGAEIKAGTVRAEANLAASGGACEEACSGHDGVDVCGESFVLCNDGESFLINP